jgi:6-phosphofructokinase 1
MLGRKIDIGRIKSERLILMSYIDKGIKFETEVKRIEKPSKKNNVSQDILGLFRSEKASMAVIADTELLSRFKEKKLKEQKIEPPTFLEAGPRAYLRHDPLRVRIAIVTTGGLAPGLHCVIHSIVKRHHIYQIDQAHGRIFGVYNSYKGLCNLADNLVVLTPKITEEWLDQGGSKLGIVRYYHKGGIAKMAESITGNLENNNIDILYIIGGDGSLRVLHEIAIRNPKRSIVGIPKTMDNDILWVWQSFGFDTAVEQATRVINTLRSEAEATRRICLVELFGAESGFVAANATLASGHVDAALIPEVFKPLTIDEAQNYIDQIIDHIEKTVQSEPPNPHAVVVIAEGVETILRKKGTFIEGKKVKKGTFVNQLAKLIEKRVRDAHQQPIPVFVNQPRHNIRAVPANAHDQIYCERLGALAVDNALAGYTNFMISQWLTEFVLVPTQLVMLGKKSIPVKGMFWKQVVSSTGQPLSPSELINTRIVGRA